MQLMIIERNNIYFSISLALHVLLLACIALRFNYLPPATHAGENDHDAINAYFVNAKATPSTPQTVKTEKAGIALKQIKPVKPIMSQTYQSHAASKGNSTSGLQALLHNAIQTKQTYPEVALDMGREGRTTVAFRLYRDGHINHAHITHSSGTESLDIAALSAVNQAAPFHGVDHYINEADNYSIDVIFELG